ncbi:adenosine deaminase/editase [Radiomyces spectabilis]|uniref:adenosine deaminase/editase n=1 Tax=Radiomyces spectabilis TaxID=64574 RepID=UPI00221F22A4|nr:adenosine deaminase/editase [Radiomyces spectabilis]KAI8374593.1 adenosine deaminase/editase [Radiomyces spectabilis]
MNWHDIPDFADKLAMASHAQYVKLPKQGKPLLHDSKAEWTVLACILAVYAHEEEYSIKVVSLGTGLKCLPFSKLSQDGHLVNDSHAEVIARRGFLKYALQEYEKNDQNSPFMETNGRVTVRPHHSFHMYISHSPCGDASMTALAEQQSAESFENFQSGKRKAPTDNNDFFTEYMYSSKKQKTEIPSGKLERGRYGFERLGILRTKPDWILNRRCPCLAGIHESDNVSDHDKLARWNVLGLQSALLSHLFDPIYLQSIVIGDMFEKECLERALYGRLAGLQDLPSPYTLNRPTIFATDKQFESSKAALEARNYTKIIPSGTAILWVPGMAKSEVIVHGRKQGAAKGVNNAKTRSCISKAAIFESFNNVMLSQRSKNVSASTYRELKLQAKTYQAAKTCLLDQCFHTWVQAPEAYEQFYVNGSLSKNSSEENALP